MKREPPFIPSTAAICSKSEENTAAYRCGDGGGMDELLAVLGYKVKTSEMADVANKLEQLTKIMCCVDEPGLSSFASDSVHYNPSDISNWVQSMLSDHNPCSTSATTTTTSTRRTSSCLVVDPFYDSDLKAIPGKAILCPPAPGPGPGPGPPTPTEQQSQSLSTDSNSGISSTTSLSSRRRCNKKIKLEENSSGWKTRPVVVVESQENGIRLVHTLMACGEAIQRENYGLAEALVKQVGYFASSQIGSMRKVATYFAQALASRIYKHRSNNTNFDDYLYETLEMHFYEACPYIKFAHFTANQALLEAFSGKKSVHVIDFSMKHGMQWPALMQALALRPEGPPLFRLTAIAPPSPNNNSSDPLQQVGFKLAHFADSLHIQFQYRGFVANCLSDLDYSLLNLNPHSEVVAVNSIFELHRLLAKQGGIDKVLGLIKHINPLIFTVVEQEANHNGPLFLDRFNESLHYYSTLFDSLESCPDTQDKLMSEVYLARQITNVVACEGVDRFERHESLPQWRTRFGSSGFEPVHIGSNAYTQASMLLDYFAGGEGYGVEEREGCLMLGWHSRPLITTSAWRPRLHSPTRP